MDGRERPSAISRRRAERVDGCIGIAIAPGDILAGRRRATCRLAAGLCQCACSRRGNSGGRGRCSLAAAVPIQAAPRPSVGKRNMHARVGGALESEAIGALAGRWETPEREGGRSPNGRAMRIPPRSSSNPKKFPEDVRRTSVEPPIPRLDGPEESASGRSPSDERTAGSGTRPLRARGSAISPRACLARAATTTRAGPAALPRRRRSRGHEEAVRCFSANSRRVASISRDKGGHDVAPARTSNATERQGEGARLVDDVPWRVPLSVYHVRRHRRGAEDRDRKERRATDGARDLVPDRDEGMERSVQARQGRRREARTRDRAPPCREEQREARTRRGSRSRSGERHATTSAALRDGEGAMMRSGAFRIASGTADARAGGMRGVSSPRRRTRADECARREKRECRARRAVEHDDSRPEPRKPRERGSPTAEPTGAPWISKRNFRRGDRSPLSRRRGVLEAGWEARRRATGREDFRTTRMLQPVSARATCRSSSFPAPSRRSSTRA